MWDKNFDVQKCASQKCAKKNRQNRPFHTTVSMFYHALNVGKIMDQTLPPEMWM